MAEKRGVAILVGAGDAIGAAVARRFAKGGYAVCICRRDAAKSQALIDELRAAGLEAHAFSVDARQEAEVQKLFAEVERTSALSRSACSTPDRTSTSPCWTPPKSCSSRPGNSPAMAASWSAAKPRATCFRAAAAPSSLPAQPRASVAVLALRHSHRRNLDYARWRKRWRANSGPKISTSCTS